ncbi:hypothetical protein RJD24_12330 [Bacillaceae bacterium IKA-2]|nr:hypothetical protein RJD24_12330 [Bacillaceae bacterium IKA-2]
MRWIYSILIILTITLGGCSSPTLLDAIEKNGSRSVEILFQDEIDKVVIFLNEDFTGQPLLSLNTFFKENSRYKYDSGTGEYAQNINLSDEDEIIIVRSVGNSSFGAVWGYVNYPNANTVIFSLEDEDGTVIYTSRIEITETNIVYEKLQLDIFEQTNSLYYKILDNEDNVIVER